MKRLLSIFSAILIGCMSLSSCDMFDLDIMDVISAFMGKDDKDDSDSGSSSEKQYLFFIYNHQDYDIYWYVPSKEYQDKMEEEFKKDYCHKVAPDDYEFYEIVIGSDDPIWTYGPEDAMPIYFFKADVIDTLEWKEIIQKKMWGDVGFFTPKDIIDLYRGIDFPFDFKFPEE